MFQRISTHLRSDINTNNAVLTAAMHSWAHPAHHHVDEPPPVRAFVTISRQPGAGAIPMAERLVEMLNAIPGGDWTAWDKELIEKVAAEHGISKQVVDALDKRPQTWLEELLSGLSSQDTSHLEEARVYKRIAMTVRALALAGHCVIVGRGGQFITAGLPGGIHLRLVAPLDHRTKAIASAFSISLKEAARRIAEAERIRRIFYHRYWPGKELTPESFTLTLNSAEVNMEEALECVIPIIKLHEVRNLEPALIS